MPYIFNTDRWFCRIGTKQNLYSDKKEFLQKLMSRGVHNDDDIVGHNNHYHELLLDHDGPEPI